MAEETCPVSKKAYWIISLLNLLILPGLFFAIVQHPAMGQDPAKYTFAFVFTLLMGIIIVLPGIILAVLASFLTNTTNPNEKQCRLRRLFLILTVIHIILITLTFTFLAISVAIMAVNELIGYNKVQKLKSLSEQLPIHETDVNEYPFDK